jgi:hypothetical protein
MRISISLSLKELKRKVCARKERRSVMLDYIEICSNYRCVRLSFPLEASYREESQRLAGMLLSAKRDSGHARMTEFSSQGEVQYH